LWLPPRLVCAQVYDSHTTWPMVTSARPSFCPSRKKTPRFVASSHVKNVVNVVMPPHTNVAHPHPHTPTHPPLHPHLSLWRELTAPARAFPFVRLLVQVRDVSCACPAQAARAWQRHPNHPRTTTTTPPLHTIFWRTPPGHTPVACDSPHLQLWQSA